MHALAILSSRTVCSISTNFCRMTKKVQSVSYLLIKGPDLAVLSVTKLFISGKTIVFFVFVFFVFINNLLTVTYNIYLTYTTLHYTIKQNTTYLIQYSTYTIGNTLYYIIMQYKI